MSMSVDDFLDRKVEQKEPEIDGNAINSFLEGAPVKKPEKKEVKPRAEESDPLYQSPMEWGAGFNDALLNTLDLPNDAFNWAAEKLGIDVRTPSTRDLGSVLRLGYPEGEEPDTGAYTSGKITATGLEFLAPILKVGGAVKTGANIATIANPSVSRGVAQKMTQPFLNAPKTAVTGEIAGGALSGYGMHEGRERFGWQGEQAFGLLGGFAPQGMLTLAPKLQNNLLKSVFPMTKQGAKPKARQILETLSESDDIIGDIKRHKGGVLEGAVISPARRSGDPDLMALEKVLIDENPELALTFRKLDEKNNAVARSALKGLRGAEGVQQAQLFLTGKYASLANKLNAVLDEKILKTKDIISAMMPATKRAAANTLVREAIDASLVAARKDENGLWSRVLVTEKANTDDIVSKFVGLLSDRYKSDDPAEILPFMYKFLGNINKKGKYKKGAFSSVESVGEVHAFRSRLLKEIRKEKKLDAPDWNKVRIMEDVQEAALNSLEASGSSVEIKDAANFSRILNQKFKGGIMSTILGSDAHGGRLSPTLTMDSVGVGAKGAENIRKILQAAPSSKDSVEQVIKLEMAYRLVNPNTGRFKSLQSAKAYTSYNDEVMDIFPKLKSDMEKAIAFEESATWYKGAAKTRLAKAKRSTDYAISKASPKRVVTTILEAEHPEIEMTRQLKRLNATGRAGIKNDIIDTIFAKAKTGKVAESGHHILSGDKMYGFWTENKKALGKPFSKGAKERIDVIINTLRLSQGKSDLPVERAKKALEATHGLVEYVVTTVATRAGAKAGEGTTGASLKTASEASKRAKRLLGQMDVGMAKKLLVDAILDEELYMALASDSTKFTPTGKNWRIIQGWMVANAVESMEETD